MLDLTTRPAPHFDRCNRTTLDEQQRKTVDIIIGIGIMAVIILGLILLPEPDETANNIDDFNAFRNSLKGGRK